MAENKTKKAPFSFYKCGMKKGDKIIYKKDSSIAATVYDERKICFMENGKENIMSVSGLAQKLLNRKNVRGTSYFTYNGKTLDKIKEESGE